MPNYHYLDTLERLKRLDENQLVELFHDLDDVNAVIRIIRSAVNYLASNPEEEATSNKDYDDWRARDDAQRYRDVKSTNESMK